jgi:PAS domain S-box-containing protein
MYGWREEEVIGKTVMEVTKPVFVNTTLEDIQKLLRQNGYWKGEAIHQRKDGGKINVLISISLMKDAKGNEQGAVTIFTDITERKHMEQALRESEEKFSRAFLASPEIIAISRLEDSLYLEVNDSFVKTTGYTREELIGHRVDEINMWVNPKEQEEMARLVVENGYIKNKEYSLRMKSGEVRQWLCSSDSINIGGKACSIAVAADITERKQAEERINHLVLTLRSIRNVNQLITREKDCDRLIQGVCDSLVESHSFGSAWIVLLDESQQPITWATANGSSNFPALIESFRQGNPPRCAQKALKQKQAVVTEDPYTMCPGCPILGGGTDIGSMTIKLEIKGHIYGVLCASMQRSLLADKDEISLFKEVATDIAFALRDIELGASNELLEQERLRSAKLESIGTLAGGIAHDFNNLLTGIMGNIGLAKTSIQPSDATFEMLDEAEKAAVRAKDLTQQLLTFAKGGKPVKKPVEIAGLVKESAAFALRGSNVRLELSLPDDLWSVEADEGQIGQVINNLVINADEAMPSGGILKIEAGNLVLTKASGLPIPNGNYVHIGIRDTGIGISQEHLQRIFEPYFTTKQKGSGLGLTTVYSIVRNHGGYILAESRQNKGSTFHIYLPALKKAAKGGRKVAKANTSQAGGKVLVMDDEEIIRKMLKSMLSLAGYEVVLSADGKEALGKYTEAMQARDPFDVVIMDLTIPGGMGGKEAIKKLLEIDPNATVIVSSGYATDPIMSEYRKHGFKAVIAKPYSVKQLRETLSGITRKKKQAD